jgi:signal transduction histidine kinase
VSAATSTSSTALNGFGEEVQQAIDEVRAFARGVYPQLLISEGLSGALVSASRYTPTPITVPAGGIRRCRPEVESAVYFTCLAAIDNAAKHAGPAAVHVRLGQPPGAAFHGLRHGPRV